MAAMATVNCLALRINIRTFGDVTFYVRFMEAYCLYIDVVLIDLHTIQAT
jgi:hypothetical protein